jgi:hypothetical protein
MSSLSFHQKASLVFFLDAHKPDSADYCRGCLMDSWSGRRERESYLSYDRTVSSAAGYLAYPTEQRETGFDVTLTTIINGHLVVYSFDDGYLMQPQDTDTTFEEGNELADLIADVERAKNILLEERALKLKQEKEHQDKCQRLARENYERQELARLKSTYENKTK